MKKKNNKKQSKQENFLIAHLKSIASGKWTKARVLNAISLFRMREGRGSGIFNQFWDYVRKGADITIIFWAVFNLKLLPTQLFIFGIIYVILSYCVGYFDETKIKLWQKEQEMAFSYINPFFQRLEKKIDKILKRRNK